MLVNYSMTAAAVGPARHVRSFFSKFETVHNDVITEYISSIPETICEAAEKLLSSSVKLRSEDHANHLVLSHRAKLKKFVEKFHHEADTYTEAVTRASQMLNYSFTDLVVSIHQPNLFAYGGVYKKIVLLQTLKHICELREPKRKITNLFLIVDHDFVDDFWIRVAQLPSIHHSNGILELRMPIKASNRWRLVCNTPPPRRSVLDHWRQEVISWIKNSSSSIYSSSSDKRYLFNNVEEFWQQVEDSYSRCKSYADFNSFLISRVANIMWGYDTLFVRLSDLSEVFEDGFKYLVSNFEKYAMALNKSENLFVSHGINTGVSTSSYLNAPVWLHCPCGSKASAKIVYGKRDSLLLVGKCIACKNDLQVSFGSRHNLDIAKEALHSLSPRAIPILLLLSRELGITCCASGTGGSMGYTFVGIMAFKELSIKMPFTIVWPSNDIYTGLGQSESLEQIHLDSNIDISSYISGLRSKDIA
jgi:hypothetical protein